MAARSRAGRFGLMAALVVLGLGWLFFLQGLVVSLLVYGGVWVVYLGKMPIDIHDTGGYVPMGPEPPAWAGWLLFLVPLLSQLLACWAGYTAARVETRRAWFWLRPFAAWVLAMLTYLETADWAWRRWLQVDLSCNLLAPENATVSLAAQALIPALWGFCFGLWRKGRMAGPEVIW